MGRIEYNFEGETVIVTGASSGIGRAIAHEFGAAGATVVNADLQPEPRGTTEEPTHEAIEAAGGTAKFVETDVSDPVAIESVVVAARDFGGVDVMVNNAGIHVGKSVLDVTQEEFRQVSEVNEMGVLFGCQAAARDMIERDDPGNIVNVASIRAEVALHDQILYNASKGAVKMLTRSAALDLADHGIRVNAVAPGRTSTAIVEQAGLGTTENLVKPIPLGAAAEPEDIAEATVFLATNAARYVTGEVLTVDGGWQIY